MVQIYDPVLDQWIESETGETTQRQGERTEPPPVDRQQEPVAPPTDTTPTVPNDSAENHNVESYDANSDTWHKTGMKFDQIKKANETTPVLYRIDGKILEKPDNLVSPDGGPSDYESPYPARLPEGFRPKERLQESVPVDKADKRKTLKVGRDTDNPEEIILTDSIERLRDSKDPDDKRLYRVLVNEGVDAYNQAIDAARFVSQQEGERRKRLSASDKKAFEDTLSDKPAELREAYRKGGIAAYNDAVNAYNRNLEQTGVRLPDGYYIPDADFKKLPDKYAIIALTEGYDDMLEAIKLDVKAQDLALKELEPYKKGEDYDIVRYIADPKAGQRSWKETQLLNAGFSQDDIKKTEQYVDKGPIRNYFEGLGAVVDVPPDAKYEYKGKTLTREQYTEVKREYAKNLSAKITDLESKGYSTGGAVRAAREIVGPEPAANLTKDSRAKMISNYQEFAKSAAIPFYATIKDWNNMTPGQQAFWLTADAALTALMIGGVARAGVTAGRAATATATQSAREVFARAALKGAAGEVFEQTMAPVTLLLHPVQSAKAAVNSTRNVAEDILDPRKISNVVLSTSESTLRIPINRTTTEAQAMATRDLIMETYGKRNGRVFVQVGDNVIEVQESPFMSEVRKSGGGYATATPDITPFEKPITSAYKPGQRELEQGIFFANEPLERFAISTARGVKGEKNGFYIVSDETIAKMRSSNKTYLDTAELERVLPVGESTSGPAQKLYTRIGPDSIKAEILLEKPLTPAQLLKLKVKIAPTAVKSLLSPGIEIKGSGPGGALTADEFNDLARELRASGNSDIASRLVYAENFSRTIPRARAIEPRPGSLPSSRQIAEARQNIIENNRRLAEMESYRPVRMPVRDARAELSRSVTRINREGVSRGELRRATEHRRELLRDIERRGGRGDERVQLRRATARTEATERAVRQTERTTLEKPGVSRLPVEGIPRRPIIPEHNEPGRPVRPGKIMGKTDKETRRMIATSQGAIAWRQGELNGQDRWDVITNIYKPGAEQYAIVMGKAPQGATIVKGPGSARRTAQILYGDRPLPRTAYYDSPGLFTAKATPISGNKFGLDFVRDTEISGKNPSISQKGSIFPLAGKK